MGHVDCDCHNYEAGKHHVGTKLRKLLRASRVIVRIILVSFSGENLAFCKLDRR
jgi:hypothetical protein